jgi:hypothetical protein
MLRGANFDLKIKGLLGLARNFITGKTSLHAIFL